MKKFWKYIAIATLTVVMAPLTACDDDSELGPKDKANYEANFAYCLEADNNYSTLSYRYSGKLIETGETTLQTVPVHLTKPAPADIAIEVSSDPALVDEYNEANQTSYEALTDVSFSSSVVTIKKGEYVSADRIELDLGSCLAGNDKDLLIPVVLKSASDGVTISKTSRFFIAFSYSANVVSIEGIVYEAGKDQSLWADKMENVELQIVSSIFTADAETTVKFEVDNSLVDAYNQANEEQFLSMEGVTVEDAVILPGENKAKVRLNVTDYSQLETGYVVPVRISAVEGDGAIADENASVAYIVIAAELATITSKTPSGSALTPGSEWVLKVNGETEYDYYGYKYSWADDMFDNDDWSGNYTEPGDVIEIDFGTAKTITGIGVRYYSWYYTVSTYASVRTSVDGVTWKNWKKIPDYSGEDMTYITFSAPTEARFVEIVLGEAYYYYGIYMCDIYAYGNE